MKREQTKPSRAPSALLLTLTTGVLLTIAASDNAYAGFSEGAGGNACSGGVNDLLIGADNDNVDNPLIQPHDAGVDQSLSNTDVLLGGPGCDVVIGLLGSDVIRGGTGRDVIIGGTEQATAPNSDIMFGDGGNDINIWAGGDGSEAFLGGSGRDALIFGVIDRDGNNVPIMSPVTGIHEETGLPTADSANAPGFCTLEDVSETELGYDFLVRFFVRATGALAVTVRVADVEQVFCSSEAGGAITFADLTEDSPHFMDILQEDVATLNETVALIIR